MRQQQPESSLSFLSNRLSPTTILHSSYKAAAGTASSIYSASNWLGGKVFGSFNTLITSEQKFNAEQAQRAKTNLPTLEVELAEKVRSAVTILATGTAFYYNPSLALGVFAALRLIPQNAVRAVYQTVFNNDQAAVAQALSTQDLITKGFSLYYGMLPASLIQAVVVGGVEATLKTFNSNNALPQSYLKYNVGERLWLWSGMIASVYQDHRFVTSQQIQKNIADSFEVADANVTRVNTFNCRLTIGGEECSIVQQSIAVQNQQTGDMFYATVNVDATGVRTPVSLATIAADGIITNHSLGELDYTNNLFTNLALTNNLPSESLLPLFNKISNDKAELIVNPTVELQVSSTDMMSQSQQPQPFLAFRNIDGPRKMRVSSVLQENASILNFSAQASVTLMKEVGSYRVDGLPSPDSIILSNDERRAYFFVTSESAGSFLLARGVKSGRLETINVTDTANPTYISSYNVSFSDKTQRVNARISTDECYVFVTSLAWDSSPPYKTIVDKTYVVNVTNITNQTLITSYQTTPTPFNPLVLDPQIMFTIPNPADVNTIFAVSNGGVQMLNITDRGNPVPLLPYLYKPADGIQTVLFGALNYDQSLLLMASTSLAGFINSEERYKWFLDVTDITRPNKPILSSRYDVGNQPDQYHISSMAVSKYKNIVFIGGQNQLKIIEVINVKCLSAPTLRTQTVGSNILEHININFSPSRNINTTLIIDPDSVTIKQLINDTLTQQDIPYWLSLERNSMFLTGIAPKEETGRRLSFEVSFTPIPLSSNQKYINKCSIFTSFNVISSLNLFKTTSNYTLFNIAHNSVPTLLIDAISGSVTLRMTVSSANTILFIISDDFGPIRPSFNRATSQFVAIGPIYGLNPMLERLRYVSLVPSAPPSTFIQLELTDAGLNNPVLDRIDMSFFRENQAPICNKNITEARYEINSNLDYTIPLDVCVDADDSINGASLKYNAFMMNNSVASPLPIWLSFTSDQRRFFGTIPAAAGAILIQVNVTDGYAIDHLLYRFIFHRPPNRAPIVEQQIPLQSAQIGNDYEYFVPITTFSDPDGDPLTLNASGMPSWLEFNATAWRFYGSPSPSDTDSFNDRQTIISLQASDGDKTGMTSFIVAVRGDSVVSLIISYGGTALGIIGTIYGFYVYRNPIYNAFAWNRYRHLPEQFGQQVEEINLFAVSPKVRQSTIPLAQNGIKSAELIKWSTQMPKGNDEFGEYYFKHTVLDRLGDAEAVRKRKKITETKSFFVQARPTVTTRQKLKAGLFTAIPKVFNASIGRVLARFGIKMNPNYLAIYEPVYGDLPSWLSYNQNTGVLKVVDVENDDNTPFDTPIVVQFFNSYTRIMEEISFIVRDESELCRLFPGATTIANGGHTSVGHASPQPSSTTLASTTSSTDAATPVAASLFATTTPNSVTSRVNTPVPVADIVAPITITKDKISILTAAPIKTLGENSVPLLVPRPPPSLIAPSVPAGRVNSSSVVGGNGASLPIAAHFLPKVPVNSLDAHGAGAGRLRTSAFTRPVESRPSARTETTPVTHLFGMHAKVARHATAIDLPMVRRGGYKPLLYKRQLSEEAADSDEEMRINLTNIFDSSKLGPAGAAETRTSRHTSSSPSIIAGSDSDSADVEGPSISRHRRSSSPSIVGYIR